jgi:hypothetical protein
MRSGLRLALGCLLLAALSRVVAAQSDSTRSYDANALRVEPHWGDYRILRGVNGPVVGTIGTLRRFDLTKLVGPSENALREAREFNRDYTPGMLASMIGGLAVGVSLGILANNEPSWGLIAAEAAGAGLVFYGGIRLNRAYNALSKSIWWYNRDLEH